MDVSDETTSCCDHDDAKREMFRRNDESMLSAQHPLNNERHVGPWGQDYRELLLSSLRPVRHLERARKRQLSFTR